MNTAHLYNKLKSQSTAYVCWLFGCQYLYLGRPGLFLVYFFSIGGFGLWALADLFRIPGMVEGHNAAIMGEIERAERAEKMEQAAMLSALASGFQNPPQV